MNVTWIASGQRAEDDENFAGRVGWEVTLRRDGTSESYKASGSEETRSELHTIPSHFNRILETRFTNWLEFVSVRYGFEDILWITCNITMARSARYITVYISHPQLTRHVTNPFSNACSHSDDSHLSKRILVEPFQNEFACIL